MDGVSIVTLFEEAYANLMDKKLYTIPELTLLGEMDEITKGEGSAGNDDQWFFFRWGEDPDPSSGG